jgi:hypothetical protein
MALPASLFVTAAWAAPADDVKTLLEQGKPAEAYQRARQHPELFGNARFDLYYGVAAVNAGKPSEGVLALERYVLSAPEGDPSRDQARLELARGYYLLGEDARAREEFESLLSRKPPPQIARVIEEYLDALAARATRFQSRWAWHAEFGGGHDSNVPSGVEDPNITLPIFGDITLSDSAVRKSDRFYMAAFGVRFSKPIRSNVQAFTTFNAQQTANRTVDTFDQDVISGGAGLMWQIGDRAMTRLTYGLTTQTIDHEKYRDSESLSGEFGYQLGQTTYAIVGAQGAKFRYGGFNFVRDADYRTATLGFKQRLPGLWRPDVDVAISKGKEDIALADRQDLSRDLVGGRVGFSAAPLALWTFSAGATWLNSDYKAADPLLGVTREDKYTAYDLSAVWTPPFSWAKNWTVRGEYLHAKNKSNLALYEYKRRAATVKLRYDFK